MSCGYKYYISFKIDFGAFSKLSLTCKKYVPLPSAL